jgi:Rhodopirellula transposase DDE domain
MEKKLTIGEYYQEGRGYCTEPRKVNDHDFISSAEGVVNPYGIYDTQRNEGYMRLGTSKDTSEFACDCIKDWWERYGKHLYPKATSILILADGGGSNSSRHYIFKEDLQRLVNEIGVEIRIAHYPPYTSKYNPIEHRMFCHVTRACGKAVFTSVEMVKGLMEKASTSTGLKVFVSITDKIYKTARKASADFKENMPIKKDDSLGQWNYRAVPQIA